MLKMKRVPQSTKVRVIVNGVHFYSTAKQIRNGVGDHYPTNAAVQKCLESIEYYNSTNSISCRGLVGVWEGLNVQLDLV